jgi:curved DNA-binding protein CbpA
MTQLDPHRTLGVGPDAGQAEIKRAYRKLAKQYHPDSAGERQLSHFLAIQAAYEALVQTDPAGRRTGAPRTGARPAEGPAWQADPARARATRDAYRTRRRGPTSGGPASGPDPSASGRAGPSGRRAPSGSTGPEGAAERAGETSSGSGTGGARSRPGAAPGMGSETTGRSRRRRKATIGSTSYDGADREPFDPAWEGATWYGAGSGTYWTINPKEYADPRKHGPEYLARSLRPNTTGHPPTATPGGTVTEEDGSPLTGTEPGSGRSAEDPEAKATDGPPPAGGPGATASDADPATETIRGRIRAAFGRSARVR